MRIVEINNSGGLKKIICPMTMNRINENVDWCDTDCAWFSRNEYVNLHTESGARHEQEGPYLFCQQTCIGKVKE